MLNSGKKYSSSYVIRKNFSERNKKPYPPPPFKLNGRFPLAKVFNFESTSMFEKISNWSSTDYL